MDDIKGNLLSDPGLYHHLRQVMTGGMPFDRWIKLYGLDDPTTQVFGRQCLMARRMVERLSLIHI